MVLRLTISFFLVCILVSSVAGQEFFWPTGHDLEGLPQRNTEYSVYDDDSLSELNRLHRLLFIAEFVPQEIQSALPSERHESQQSDAAYYVRGWYFQKRKGVEKDRMVYGGDIRVSPRFEFNSEERSELVKLLKNLVSMRSDSSTAALADPMTALLLQWDLLSVWWTLEKSKIDDLELLSHFAEAIQSLAQARDALERLPSGLSELLSRFSKASIPSTKQPYMPPDFDGRVDGSEDWIEVGRKSSTLFKADRSLRVTRVYLSTGNRSQAIELLNSASSETKAAVIVPIGTTTILSQQLIAIDDTLSPVVTPVLDELRVRVVDGKRELKAESSTSSRDGSSHWIYMRTRFGTVRPDEPDFRFVPDTAQSLFVEYGTRKHATFAAQCALCHRRTNNGGEFGEGILSLARFAKPHLAEPNERVKLAEQEMTAVISKLKERLAGIAKPDQTKTSQVQPTVDSDVFKALAKDEQQPEQAVAKLPSRPERTAEENRDWVAYLRDNYAKSPNEWPAPSIDADVKWQEIGLLPPVAHPTDNPHSKSKELLGKTLFFDPRLSGSGQIACASCHDPDLGWADGRTTSFGHGRALLTRNAPTIRNAGFVPQLFWDGRAHSLEDQVIKVLTNPNEMRSSEAVVMDLIRGSKGYRKLFAESFGNNEISIERVAQAIGCYERTIVGGSSRFDIFMKGGKCTNLFASAVTIGLGSE